jgi:hypothetical protein
LLNTEALLEIVVDVVLVVEDEENECDIGRAGEIVDIRFVSVSECGSTT